MICMMQVGVVIGKAGTIVKQIRDETGARIRVVDGVPNCDERVIVISAKDDAGKHSNSAMVRRPRPCMRNPRCRVLAVGQLFWRER
jgi:poly(rC)-binding protein 2/3/4